MAPTLLHDGRFELLRDIGSGGVGTVWRAHDRKDDKLVALKVLHPHLRADRIVCLRFRREVEIARSLNHPGLVRAFDLFEDDEALSFSMELLEGRTLKEEILAKGPLPIAEAARIARSCLHGLAAAHAAGIVHRDFKPQNVFLCGSGEVKLLDFGFARVANAAGLTTKSLVLCTPDYAAPEVIGGSPVDGRADLYGLGVTLFEALTGQLPFRGATPFDLLRQHLESAPPSVRARRPEVPVQLDATISRLMAKAPEARFPACEAVLSALDEPAAETLSQRRPAVSACAACGEPREIAWPICPACGASERGHAGGDWMVVLTRASSADAPAALREVVRSFGLEPKRALAKASHRATSGLPKVVVKNVSEPLARIVRERCLARDLQVELRRISENNSDLLHRSNTPGYLFAAALLVPWGLLAIWSIERLVLGGGSLALVAAVLASGPIGGILALKRSHLLLPALARLPVAAEQRPFPASLAARYRQTLKRLESPSVRGTLQRIFERALIVHGAAHEGPPHVRMLLEEPCRSALVLAERALELAEQAEDAWRRLLKAGEASLFEELEALKARLQADPSQSEALRPVIAAREAALAQAAQLELAQIQASQRLLKTASTLELAAAHALATGLPAAPEGLSLQLERLVVEARTASEVASEVAKEPQLRVGS